MQSPARDVSPYSSSFFDSITARSRESAGIVVPIVMEMVQPKSVIDVGCGVGTWVAAFSALGVTDILGVDGPYVDRTNLQIMANDFLRHDLTNPLILERTFDLVISLEVAEHLPSIRANDFVAELTRLAPCILFSAAIPGQVGTHHVNCQWPAYWVERFTHHNYIAIDCMRWQIWDNPDIDWWYAQNMMFFVDRERLDDLPALRAVYQTDPRQILSVVHPQLYETLLGNYVSVWSPRQLLAALPRAVWSAMLAKIRR